MASAVRQNLPVLIQTAERFPAVIARVRLKRLTLILPYILSPLGHHPVILAPRPSHQAARRVPPTLPCHIFT